MLRVFNILEQEFERIDNKTYNSMHIRGHILYTSFQFNFKIDFAIFSVVEEFDFFFRNPNGILSSFNIS